MSKKKKNNQKHWLARRSLYGEVSDGGVSGDSLEPECSSAVTIIQEPVSCLLNDTQ